ncbi:MAG: guanylate kinase [Rhizobiales bacterium]|nr:guanylate kinase [Hyphomicrobiales bacterium]MBI3674250.1 guanylate kinase [Hyphomicrobiales bacterium]
MWRRRAPFSHRRRRWAASSTSSPRSSTARPTRSAPRLQAPLSRSSASNSRPSSTRCANRFRTLNRSTISIARRGLLLVMSSPSGAGKTTLSRRLLASDPGIAMSVSVTTRKPRPGEVEGRDYHFISKEEFARQAAAGELLEWAEVFGNSYGTPKKPVEEALAQGRDVLFDIDWQGTQQLAQAMREDLVRIFILPPSAEELRQRLIGRAQDTATVVAKRMAEASREISHWPEYDYVIVNDDLDEADRQITAILAAERLRRRRRTGLTAFVRDLTKDL